MAIRSALVTLAFVAHLVIVQGKLYERCALATRLAEANVSWKALGDWVCLAESASQLNSNFVDQSKLNPKSVNYGIFKINNQFWCDDGTGNGNNGCNASCSDLINDDPELKESIRCALIIYDESLSFEPWIAWRHNCEGKNVSKYIQDCTVIPGQTPPVITNWNNTVETFVVNSDSHLDCKATGYPLPELEWKYNKTTFPKLYPIQVSNKTLRLTFPNVRYDHEGNYTCIAKNIAGSQEATFRVDVTEGLTHSRIPVGATVGLPVIVFLITIIGAAVGFRYFLIRRKLGLNREEIREFQLGKPEKINQVNFAHENAQFRPYNSDYEIPKSNLELDATQLLGSGEYGIVMKGLMEGRTVAVKSVKLNTDKLYLRSLLSELKIMIYLGKHPNIVNLVGAQTKDLNKGLLNIVVEYCTMGSLESFLRKHKDEFLSSWNKEEAVKSQVIKINNGYVVVQNKAYENLDQLNSGDLLRWSYQIAVGMEYLSSKKVIHGDLATRNVLLTENLTAKITDFGLSRQLYDYTIYVKTQKVPLPWRSMAIESLREMNFSTQSDVWSYGVTLWEIFSLGDVPYPGLFWSTDFPDLLEKGLRLHKPLCAPYHIYDGMMQCWNLEPSKRPDFHTIAQWFNTPSSLIKYN